ncbi:MAG: hypothetical protein NTZ32_26830 [Planctomycetales bacterium]|nr:hypothetical protein [Planctomycetales bacterium]
MIITLKITLIRGMYYECDWLANIELDESSTLEDLHHAIQDAVDFDNDHLYSFYLSRTDRSRNREFFDDENGLIFSKTLQDLFPLPAKQCLFYLFDWGDEWVFKISPSRKRPHEPVKRVKYPRVESESGIKPVQYPGDEDDDE